MRSTLSGWEVELAQWLKPFLDRLGHKTRRRMCPLYVTGLIGPGDRKSVQPMAERLAPGDYDQLHHFVAAGVWDAAPLETELLIQADRLVGGSDAVLVIDDTAVPKKGKALGRCRFAICFGARQERQLPDAGITNTRP
jgi:SRSO17 transposase